MDNIKKNNDYDIVITDINHDGQGIGKIDKYTVFVDGVVIGEKVRIKLIKANKTYGYGKLLEIYNESPNRIEPECNISKRCGGCTLCHVDYKAQLEYKKGLVKENLKRIGKIDIEVNDTIGMDNPYNYRNKAQFPVRDVNGKDEIGFYAKNSHNIIPCDDCKIQDKNINEVKNIIQKFIQDNNIRTYNEDTKQGNIRHILVRIGKSTGQIMVVLVINNNTLPKVDVLVEMLKASVKGLYSVVLNINNKNTNVILGQKSITVWGHDYIEDYIGDLKFRISPKSFYQVNPTQTKVLYDKVVEYAGLTGSETVFDLYCGIGTITLSLANKAKFVYGVEIVPDAVRNAKENAHINNIDNVCFVEGVAEDVIPNMYKEGIRADVVVVDPPRKGCDAKLIDTLVSMYLDRIVYVSCNPATLARDLKILGENGFVVQKIQPVDMFPMSMHVETVVLLGRKKVKEYFEYEYEPVNDDYLKGCVHKATYGDIAEWVQKEYGLHVSNLYIAQVKRECGLDMGENYNKGAEGHRVPKCPPEKREAILAALRYFGVIE